MPAKTRLYGGRFDCKLQYSFFGLPAIIFPVTLYMKIYLPEERLLYIASAFSPAIVQFSQRLLSDIRDHKGNFFAEGRTKFQPHCIFIRFQLYRTTLNNRNSFPFTINWLMSGFAKPVMPVIVQDKLYDLIIDGSQVIWPLIIWKDDCNIQDCFRMYGILSCRIYWPKECKQILYHKALSTIVLPYPAQYCVPCCREARLFDSRTVVFFPGLYL